MIPSEDGFSIVLVGRWNPHIFSTGWVTEHLKRDADTPVKVGFSLNNPEAPRQLIFDRVCLYPAYGRLDIRPASLTVDDMDDVERVARTILSQLPHTPLSAIGVNYEFRETIDREAILTHFSFADAGQIDASQYRLTQSRIGRSFALSDRGSLNLTVSWNEDAVSLDFNYHADITTGADALGVLDSHTARSRYTETCEFIKAVYELEVEEATENDDEKIQDSVE